jgi:hypothetical protein
VKGDELAKAWGIVDCLAGPKLEGRELLGWTSVLEYLTWDQFSDAMLVASQLPAETKSMKRPKWERFTAFLFQCGKCRWPGDPFYDVEQVKMHMFDDPVEHIPRLLDGSLKKPETALADKAKAEQWFSRIRFDMGIGPA